MSDRILGPSESRRRGFWRYRLILLPVAAIAAILFLITSASAVHELDLFELDRNAADAPGTTGDDWDTEPKPDGDAEVFTGISPDIGADGGTQFQGGGSKDNNNINQWLWKEGEPLDKDDITNAYAAGYVADGVDENDDGVDDFITYFGLDRLSVDGSAQVGFWFLHNQVNLTNVKSQGGFLFSGVHQDGDVLVQSNFSNGGVISSISVFEWQSGALVPVGTGGDCVDTDPNTPGNQPLADGDFACATVNQTATPSPWQYIPKGSSTDSDFPTSAFFEGGINLSAFDFTGCVSTFMAETRSSTPFDARLKDFALDDFDTCQPSVSTQSSTNSTTLTPGSSVSDTATVTGTSLTGGTAPTPAGTVDFFLCQPNQLSAAGDCPSGGSKVGATKTLNASGVATSDATTNTNAVGRYCWRAEYNAAAGSPYEENPSPTPDASHTNATTECFTTIAQPTTTVTKQFVFPQDAARIDASSGGDLAGSVKFELFDSLADCLDTTPPIDVKYTRTVAISGAAPQTASTSNTSYAITDGTTHYWKVTYDSTNAAQLDSVSPCHDPNATPTPVNGETTAVTFVGNSALLNVGSDGTVSVP